jgi:ketosteroid isomerase-like protein
MGDDSENLVREVWRRWNEGERELNPELFDPAFTVHSHLTGGTYRGEREIQVWISEIDQQFDGWELRVRRTKPLADGRILVHGSIRGHGRASGIELDEPAAWIVALRSGRMLAIHNFIGVEAVKEAEKEAAG